MNAIRTSIFLFFLAASAASAFAQSNVSVTHDQSTIWTHDFVNASIERFKKTGQRVVVVGNQVFGLGIPDTVTLTPIVGAAGWRFAHEHVTPYFGGGIGKVLYKEDSSFDDEGESIDTRFTRYH